MTSSRKRWISSALGVVVALILVEPLFASGTYTPPLPPRTNRKLLTGKKLWKSKKIVGPGGKTCAACHDSRRGEELSRASLQRKLVDLPKLVYFEIVSRSNNPSIRPGGPEIEALVAHLVERYNLEAGPAPIDNAQASFGIAKARDYYLEGRFAEAQQMLRSVLSLDISPAIAAEAYILLGSIHQIRGDEEQTLEAFTEVFKLYPDAAIDAEVFSPKTVDLFEAVRQSWAREALRRQTDDATDETSTDADSGV